jgi:hypothetical protein
MRFARSAFALAGAWGLRTLTPLFFVESRIGAADPPPITLPECFYGFTGIALAWQLAFFLVAAAPARLRPLMPAALVDKLVFGGATLALYAAQRVGAQVLAFGLIDLAFGALFAVAFARLRLQAGACALPADTDRRAERKATRIDAPRKSAEIPARLRRPRHPAARRGHRHPARLAWSAFAAPNFAASSASLARAGRGVPSSDSGRSANSSAFIVPSAARVTCRVRRTAACRERRSSVRCRRLPRRRCRERSLRVRAPALRS